MGDVSPEHEHDAGHARGYAPPRTLSRGGTSGDGAGRGRDAPSRPAVRWLVALNLAVLLAVAALIALGTWQVHRRAWKLDLIARVEARLAADPVAAPGPETWAAITDEADAYRRVVARGRYAGPSTLVQAVTEYGGGHWLLTPLVTDRGFTVLVNRGFVPGERRDPAAWPPPEGSVTVTGLLRLSEPGGAFLRSNDPAAGRWHSRDVRAIGAAEGLTELAPYFIDAARDPERAGPPVGGLTVVAFHNNHLVYAATWYVLAAMALAGLVYVDRDALRRRRSGDPAG